MSDKEPVEPQPAPTRAQRLRSRLLILGFGLLVLAYVVPMLFERHG